MTKTTSTLPTDTGSGPIERAVQFFVKDCGENAGTIYENYFEDNILKIELNPEEQELFDVMKKAADAWREGKLTIGKKSVEIRIAGGWVRDKILGLETHDVDVALDACTGVEFAHCLKEYHSTTVQEETDDRVDRIKSKSKKIGKIGVIAANPAQSKHLETACVNIFGNDVDFSNLRHETYAEDSRIPETVMGTPLEDSFRRDCTMNALYYNLNFERIEDWTHRGLRDLLQTKVIQTPLKAFQTFQDDPLRVLRVIRFAVRYRMQLSEEIMEACQHPQIHEELLRKVSRERVGNEIEGMLSGKHANPIKALDLICQMKLAECVFFPPEAFEIKGTIGLAQLRHFPYKNSDTDGKELSQLRAVAWEESRECLQILSVVLESFGSDVKCASTIERRLVYLAIVLLPYVKLQYLEKQKTKYVVEYMIREGIKFKNKDVLFSGLILQNLDRMILLLNRFQKIDTDDTSLLRLEAGLLLRSTKDMWLTTLVVATVCLSRNPTSSQDVSDWCACAKDFFQMIVVKMNLDGCWKTKPLMNGKELIRVLELNRGPEVGVYMEEQVKWILTNPKGTIEELHGHLKCFKKKSELENDGENLQPVLKKIHLE